MAVGDYIPDWRELYAARPVHIVTTAADLPQFGQEGDLYVLETENLVCYYRSRNDSMLGEYVPLTFTVEYADIVKQQLLRPDNIQEEKNLSPEVKPIPRPNRLKMIFSQIKSRS